jgi:hypothetical protein
MGFYHLSALPSDPGQGPEPPVKHALGLPATDKPHPLQTLCSVGLKRLASLDITIGTHVHLTLHTRVWNTSHHLLTSLDQGYTPKYHHDSARG